MTADCGRALKFDGRTLRFRSAKCRSEIYGEMIGGSGIIYPARGLIYRSRKEVGAGRCWAAPRGFKRE